MRLTIPLCLVGIFTAANASAQAPRFAFSMTWHGPMVSAPDPQFGFPLTEGDILVPSTGPHPFIGAPTLGPVFSPTTLITHGPAGLGLAPGCIGHPPGTPCWVEVDALSFGSDARVLPNGIQPGGVWFSVDEFAFGVGASPFPPSIAFDAPAGDSSGGVYLQPLFIPPGPVPPFAAPPINYGVIDADGYGFFTGFTSPGVGLIEPNLPFGGPLATGDDIDAFDSAEVPLGFGPLPLFSLDSQFFDPLRGIPNSGSAIFPGNGFLGGDVLTIGPIGAPVVWAPSVALGLDRAAGPDSDDLDALSVWDNGDGVFQPSLMPLDWTTGATDMVLFSVRRGSAVIGLPDSIFGMPIAEGDILTTPFVTGVSPFPGIFICAENLGLMTQRSFGVPFGDDLDGLDILRTPHFDCNGNGVEDAVDIFSGLALDGNMNGIPDSCEVGIGTQYCFCTSPLSPCGNAFNGGGCINASGTGAVLSGAGSTSVTTDNMVLTTTGMNPFGFALTFMGTTAFPGVPAQNGVLCAVGTNYRFPPFPTGLGTGSLGPGIVGMSIALNPPAGHITAGTTWSFQTWYRDVGGPCGAVSNFSNALSVTFTP